jgi:hypothetical protein
MTYDGMEVANGQDAGLAWQSLVRGCLDRCPSHGRHFIAVNAPDTWDANSESINPLFRNHSSHSTPLVSDVPAAARNKMNVSMSDCLACNIATVGTHSLCHFRELGRWPAITVQRGSTNQGIRECGMANGGAVSAFLTTSATVSRLIPRRLQYADSNHTSRGFTPLLELQERQHREMFSLLTIRASLTMCSQLGRAPARPLVNPNTMPQ